MSIIDTAFVLAAIAAVLVLFYAMLVVASQGEDR